MIIALIIRVKFKVLKLVVNSQFLIYNLGISMFCQLSNLRIAGLADYWKKYIFFFSTIRKFVNPPIRKFRRRRLSYAFQFSIIKSPLSALR